MSKEAFTAKKFNESFSVYLGGVDLSITLLYTSPSYVKGR